MPVQIDPNEVMDKRRLAEVLRCTVRTIERRRNRGHLPQPFVAGREPTWLGSTIIEMYERKAKRQ